MPEISELDVLGRAVTRYLDWQMYHHGAQAEAHL